jgi:hypothetical protein
LVSPSEELLPDSWKLLPKIAMPVSGSLEFEIASFNDFICLVTRQSIIRGQMLMAKGKLELIGYRFATEGGYDQKAHRRYN